MNVYPYPSRIEKTGASFFIDKIAIHGARGADLSSISFFLQHAYKQCGVTAAENGKGYPVELKRGAGAPESYTLSVKPEKTVLTGADRAGVLYGLTTLLQLMRNKSMQPAEVSDAPFKRRRGVHVYMPSRENIPFFYRMIDGLAVMKFNTIIMETGAGMAFTRRPEINAAWRKLVKDTESFPGGPRGVQRSEAYWKDSIHTEIGGGDCLTQDEVRSIVEYAKGLCFDVIPEIQHLSHAYYLTAAYREIAERPFEPFPDSICPSNPLAYEIYFDVAEEIMDVFRPNTVSIGHDEVRILGCCPICKNKSGAELLSYEINKLYDFYKSKDIEVMMWGEKLMDLTAYSGRRMGGAKEYKTDARGRVWDLPETHGAIEAIPKDIIQLDWYHMLAEDTAKIFADKGFNRVLYGNFRAEELKDAVKRLNAPGVLGAEVSSWNLADETVMGADGVITQFAWGGGVLWSDKYSDESYLNDNKAVVEFLPRLRGILRGKAAFYNNNPDDMKIFYRGGDVPFLHLPKPEAFYLGEDLYKRIWDDSPASATSCHNPSIEIYINETVKTIGFVTASEQKMKTPPSFDFADTSGNVLCMFYVFYADGSIEPIEIKYGVSTGVLETDWGRRLNPPSNSLEEIDADTGETANAAPFYYIADKARAALSYLTDPIVFRAVGNYYTLYAYEWANPHPEKTVLAVRHVLTTDNEKYPGQALYLFAAAGFNNRSVY